MTNTQHAFPKYFAIAVGSFLAHAVLMSSVWAIIIIDIPIADPGFESPVVVGFDYNPNDPTPGSSVWDFGAGQSGITSQDFAFADDYLSADGIQFGFLQGNSSIAQNIIDPSLGNFGGQTLYLTFDAAGRVTNTQNTDFLVRFYDINGGNELVSEAEAFSIPIGTIDGANRSVTRYETSFVYPESFAGGSQLRIHFEQNAPAGLDLTTIIDSVRLSNTPISLLPQDPFVPLGLPINGDFSSISNQTFGPFFNPTAFNLAGSNGEFINDDNTDGFVGSSIDVNGWSPFRDDPDNLVGAIGTVNVDDGTSGRQGAGAELDGTFYLDNLWVSDTGNILLNSASNYRNGIVNEDIFGGIDINPNATYRVNGEFLRVAGGADATVNFAVSTGTGTAATDPANEIAGIEIPVIDIDTGAITEMEEFSFEITGADLLSAGGQINLVADLTSTTAIPGFPGSVSFADSGNPEFVSQVRIDNISVDISLPGDADNDFDVDGDDLAIWGSNFGQIAAQNSPGDFVGDSIINGNDFLTWQRNFNGSAASFATAAAAAVPEPGSSTLLVFSVVALSFNFIVKRNTDRV